MRWVICVVMLSWVALVRADGVELVVQLPDNVPLQAAVARAEHLKLETVGAVKGQTLHFSNLLPSTPYNLQLTLRDGVILQGVDLSWYNDEAAKDAAGPLDGEDHKQIAAQVMDADPNSFYNQRSILHLTGDHDRAIGLVELLRDKDFHAGKGQVVWRVEIWYFRNQAGGWEIVSQQNKVLDRQRFTSHKAYWDYVAPRRWIPGLGGIRIDAAEGKRQITLPAAALAPIGATTRLSPSSRSD